MNDPVRIILRGLSNALGGPIDLVERHSVDWASITFAGGRHRLRLRSAINPTILATSIGEIDFLAHDHLVADIIFGAVSGSNKAWLFEIEALTVEV